MLEKCDENLISPSDYTIKITNLPKNKYSAEAIEKMLRKQFRMLK